MTRETVFRNGVCVGTRGRTAPQRLDRRLEEEEDDADLFGLSRSGVYAASDSDTDQFVINTEPVGDILAVSIAVRHRHLTDEWYLRHVLLSDPERTRTRHFPCHNVVLSKATLRPGEGIYTIKTRSEFGNVSVTVTEACR